MKQENRRVWEGSGSEAMQTVGRYHFMNIASSTLVSIIRQGVAVEHCTHLDTMYNYTTSLASRYLQGFELNLKSDFLI